MPASAAGTYTAHVAAGSALSDAMHCGAFDLRKRSMNRALAVMGLWVSAFRQCSSRSARAATRRSHQRWQPLAVR